MSTLHGQKDMTSEKWKDDLQLLSETVHNDYSFLFKKTTVEAFDTKVEDLNNRIPSLEDHEVVAGLSTIVSSFGYGHTAIFYNKEYLDFDRLPVNLYHFSDGVYIEGGYTLYQDIIGAKLIAIEGVAVEDVLAAIRPVVPAENDQYFKGYGLKYIMIPQLLHAQGITEYLKKDIELTVEKEGKTLIRTVSVMPDIVSKVDYGFSQNEGEWMTMRDQERTPYAYRHLDKKYYFDYLPENNAVYVRYSSVFNDSEESISAFFDRVMAYTDSIDAEKLIIDVRLNGGGNNYNNRDVIVDIIQSKKINQVGNLFVIIGRRTFSACQNFINHMGIYTEAIFVGEPSAENVNFYGDSRVVTLPNSKIPVRLSWAWWQDKAEWESEEWTSPQIGAELSSEDYRSNVDPILNAALNFEGDDFVIDPMGYLTNLFMQGEIAQVFSDSKRFVADPRYKFFDFEKEFTVVGNLLINNGRKEQAVGVFQLIAAVFPESVAAQSNLAKALDSSK